MENKKNQVSKSIDILMSLLHEEWTRSGKTYAIVTVSRKKVPMMKQLLVCAINQNGKCLEDEEMGLQESLALSRENFILLRIAKKLSRAEEKQRRMITEAVLELDKEENRLYQKYLEI